MPLVRKLKEEWHPVEANDTAKYPNGFNVGDTIVITDPAILLKTRTVILVDEKTGKDIPYSTSLDCQYCNFTTSELEEYTKHLQSHVEQQKPKEEPTATEQVTHGEFKTVTEAQVAKIYSCKQCDFTAEKVIQLAQHVRNSHPSNVYTPPKPK